MWRVPRPVRHYLVDASMGVHMPVCLHSSPRHLERVSAALRYQPGKRADTQLVDRPWLLSGKDYHLRYTASVPDVTAVRARELRGSYRRESSTNNPSAWMQLHLLHSPLKIDPMLCRGRLPNLLRVSLSTQQSKPACQYVATVILCLVRVFRRE